MRSIFACLLLTTACSADSDEERVVALADFPVTKIMLSVGDHTFRAELDYDSSPRTCLVLGDDLVATVADEALVVEPGGVYGRMDGYVDCYNPEASLDHLPQVSNAKFQIKDATRTITCALDAAFVARTATLVPDGPWTGSPGEMLTVRWSSAKDLAYGMSVKIGDEDATVAYPGGDLVSFTVPLVPTGTHRLVIRRGRLSYRPVPCNRVEAAGGGAHLADGMLYESDNLTTFSVDIEIL